MMKLVLESLIFKKPGPAISITEKLIICFKNNSLIFFARSLGFNLFDLARTIAILHDKSNLN